MENKKWSDYRLLNVSGVSMNGYQEYLPLNFVPNAEALTGIKKEKQKTYNEGHDYVCAYCGNIFHRRGSKSSRVKYCSLKCKYNQMKGMPINRTKYHAKLLELSTKIPYLGEQRGTFGAGLHGKRCGTWIWVECPICHKQRWARFHHDRKTSYTCISCFRDIQHSKRHNKSRFWKGGRRINSRGYIEVRLEKDDFFYPMINRTGCVLEHRLVVAKALGRCLQLWEVVHHKHDKYPAGSNEDKQDNRYPQNLSLETVNNHTQITILENKIRDLEGKLALKKEVV